MTKSAAGFHSWLCLSFAMWPGQGVAFSRPQYPHLQNGKFYLDRDYWHDFLGLDVSIGTSHGSSDYWLPLKIRRYSLTWSTFHISIPPAHFTRDTPSPVDI